MKPEAAKVARQCIHRLKQRGRVTKA